jgi:hypothetical protein
VEIICAQEGFIDHLRATMWTQEVYVVTYVTETINKVKIKLDI